MEEAETRDVVARRLIPLRLQTFGAFRGKQGPVRAETAVAGAAYSGCRCWSPLDKTSFHNADWLLCRTRRLFEMLHLRFLAAMDVDQAA